MLPKDMTIDEIREFFSKDRYAQTLSGVTIISGQNGHSLCEMEISADHLNAMGNVMGGAIFTLADHALAIACNVGEPATVAVSNTIDFINPLKGSKLIAECTTEKSGRSIGFYTVRVTDDTGTLIAIMKATCSRKSDK